MRRFLGVALKVGEKCVVLRVGESEKRTSRSPLCTPLAVALVRVRSHITHSSLTAARWLCWCWKRRQNLFAILFCFSILFLSICYPFFLFFFLDPSLLRSNPLYIRLLSVFYPFVIPSFLTQASFSNHSMPRKLRDRSNIINSVKWRRKMQRETPMIHCLPCLGLGLWLTLTVYFDMA